MVHVLPIAVTWHKIDKLTQKDIYIYPHKNLVILFFSFNKALVQPKNIKVNENMNMNMQFNKGKNVKLTL